MATATEKTNPNTLYLTIYDGILCQKSKEPKDGYREHTTAKGNAAFIKEYDNVGGQITAIRRKENEFNGDKFVTQLIHLDDDCILTVPEQSTFWNRFVLCAENIDFSRPVTISAWKNREGKAACAFKQDGTNVQQKYTRESPNGMPQLEKTRSGKWDSRAQDDFKFDLVEQKILPAIEAARGTHKATDIVEYPEAAFNRAIGNDTYVEDEDIPF